MFKELVHLIFVKVKIDLFFKYIKENSYFRQNILILEQSFVVFVYFFPMVSSL